MRFKKLALALLCGVSVASLPAFADLVIHNNTNFPSTTRTNGFFCSGSLPSGGVTEPHSVNKVSQALLNGACAFNKENCTAEVFLTRNCSGPAIGTVVLSTTTGIKSASPRFTVNGPWEISLS